MRSHLLAVSVAVIVAIMIPFEARSATIWPGTARPVVVDDGPDSAVELGVKFRSDTNGSVTGIRFYKASTNTGTHIGNLWSSSGTLLATATFTGETASGWQQVNFTTPVAISANTVYVASYHTNSGHYSDDQNYFASNGVDTPPLHALANGVSGVNGVYAYGTGSSFPSLGWNSSNYWVDVVFNASVPLGPDVTPPTVPTGLTATPFSTSHIDLSWAASTDPVITGQTTSGVAGYQIFRDGNIAPIATTAAISYSDTGLQAATTYSYAVAAIDGAGNVSLQTLPVSATTPPTSSVLAFDDEFDAGALDTTQWVAMNRPGDSSNMEQQYYLPTNVAVSNGSLNITSKADTSVTGYSYTSGMVQWKSFNFTYGTMEFQAKLAGGQGPWPAVWLLGSNCQQTNVNSPDNIPPCNWPQPGSDEINIIETFNGNPTMINQQIHSGSFNTGCTASTADASANLHTYSLIWAPGSLTWKIDGVTTCNITSGVPSTPMFLLVDTAMGGVGGGTINDSTLPQTLSLDYVRVTLFDTAAPTVPTGLSATAVSASQINLSWIASTDNVAVTGYKVFRDSVLVAANVTGTTYNDTGLSPSTKYSYTVSAFDAAGNNSLPSSAASATTQASDTTPPSVSITSPANNATVSGSITVSANASDAGGVTKVEFYLDNVLQTTETTTPFNWSWNTTLTSNASHNLVVKAYDAAGNIGTSSTVTVTVSNTDITAPSIPTGLSATAVSSSQINLSWSASTDNVAVTGYKVFRGGVQVTSTVTGTTYNSAGLSPSTTYSYTVSAYDAAGNNSALSSAVSATTLTPDTTAPTVSISPSSGTVSGTITVSATVNDNVGVTKVEFYLDTVLQATDTATPFNWSWNTMQTSNGSHTLTAKAYDAAGNVGTSSTATVTVSNTAVSIVLVQKVSNLTTSAQNLAARLPSSVTAGNLIVVSVSGWPNLPATTAVTDSLGNTYSIAGTVLVSQGAYSAIYYARNVKGGTDTITVRTVKSGGQISMAVAEFSGVDTVSPLDKTAGVVGSGNAPSSGTMTPSMTGELIIGSGTHNGNTITTAGTGFSIIAIPTEDSDTHQPLAMEYRVLAGTSPTSAVFGLATGYPWTMNGALFRHK